MSVCSAKTGRQHPHQSGASLSARTAPSRRHPAAPPACATRRPARHPRPTHGQLPPRGADSGQRRLTAQGRGGSQAPSGKPKRKGAHATWRIYRPAGRPRSRLFSPWGVLAGDWNGYLWARTMGGGHVGRQPPRGVSFTRTAEQYSCVRASSHHRTSTPRARANHAARLPPPAGRGCSMNLYELRGWVLRGAGARREERGVRAALLGATAACQCMSAGQLTATAPARSQKAGAAAPPTRGSQLEPP